MYFISFNIDIMNLYLRYILNIKLKKQFFFFNSDFRITKFDHKSVANSLGVD